MIAAMWDRRAFGLSLMALPLASSPAFARKTGAAPPATRLNHIAVWVNDIDATARALEANLGWTRAPFVMRTAADSGVGALDLALIDANGFWIELVCPAGPGPAKETLDRRGAGAIGELNFRPHNFVSFTEDLRTKGIVPLGIDGKDLANGGTPVLERNDGGGWKPSPVQIANLPVSVAHGTSVELYDGGNPNSDPFHRRTPSRERPGPGGQIARVDRLAIMVEDIERSAAFYTDILGLRRIPEIFALDGGSNESSGGMKVSFVDAGSAWLALVQPVGEGPLLDYVRKNGDGFIAELIVEVDDLAAYHDAAQAIGIKLVDTRGHPVSDRDKAHVLEPFGDRIGYLPADAVGGMTIELSQRGPRATSLIHRRDLGWIR